MFDLANLQSGEHLMDLGSGDGRIVLLAAKRGVRATGIEVNPILIAISRLKAKILKRNTAEFHRMNLWKADLSTVDVLTLFFIQPFMPELLKKIVKEMNTGSRIVSHMFTFHDWQPTKKHGTISLYIVPHRNVSS
jgi:cyclopropane fatty-acyl-phospholipid synthase-like methyltransferase